MENSDKVKKTLSDLEKELILAQKGFDQAISALGSAKMDYNRSLEDLNDKQRAMVDHMLALKEGAADASGWGFEVSKNKSVRT